MKKLVEMSDYYNLRFGYCNSESESDFIDNINGKLNIHVAKGYDEEENSFLLIYHNNNFMVLKEKSFFDSLDILANSISDLNPLFAEIAKGLILSIYDREDYGINTFSPKFKEFYFEARETDEVNEFSPCFFSVGSVTNDCSNSKIDLNSGEITLEGTLIHNVSDFYGYLDEDDTWVIGITKNIN